MTCDEEEDIVEYNAKRRAIGLLPVSLEEAKHGRHPGFHPDSMEKQREKMVAVGDAMAELLERCRSGPVLSADIDEVVEAWQSVSWPMMICRP